MDKPRLDIRAVRSNLSTVQLYVSNKADVLEKESTVVLFSELLLIIEETIVPQEMCWHVFTSSSLISKLNLSRFWLDAWYKVCG